MTEAAPPSQTPPTHAACASFAARVGELPGLLDFVRGFCHVHPVPAVAAHRLVIVIEELFLNSVHHGHGGGSDEPIRVGLTATGADIECTYEDAAPAFVPPRQPPKHLDSAAEERPLGGLGVLMVNSLAISLRHEALIPQGNRIHFVIAADPLATAA